MRIKYRDETQQQIINYGLRVMSYELSKFVILGLLFVITNSFIEYLITIFSLLMYRKNSGGLHFQSYCACFLYSASVFMIIIFVLGKINVGNGSIFTIMAVSLVTITKCVPIINKRRGTYSDRQKKIFKYRAIVSVTIALLVAILLEEYRVYISFAIGYQTIEIMLVYIWEKGGELK